MHKGIKSITASTAAVDEKLTKPKPLDRPVIGSVFNTLSTTSPYLEKYSFRSSDDKEKQLSEYYFNGVRAFFSYFLGFIIAGFL